MRRISRAVVGVAVAAAVGVGASMARATDTVGNYVRIRGQGDNVLQGLGLVVGLNGTGDRGSDLAVARPLAQLLRNMGNPIESFEELAASRSVALVMVTCVVPIQGAAQFDHVRARVSVLHSATSLEGGELLMAPLRSASPGDPLVYALASGLVTADGAETATAGWVEGGARITRDIRTTPDIGGSFDLIVNPAFVGFQAVSYLAGVIQDDYFLAVETTERIAVALDPRTIRVTVPAAERENVAGFIGQVLQTRVSAELLGLPARVVADTRAGVITFDGSVEISPAVITHRDLVITTTLPPPVPAPETPLVERTRWAGVPTGARPAEMARLEGLLESLNRLDVTTLDQIEILKTLHAAGKLHAKLIIDGVEQ